jgi:hypothetical protein
LEKELDQDPATRTPAACRCQPETVAISTYIDPYKLPHVVKQRDDEKHDRIAQTALLADQGGPSART